jgi:Uncharacterized protein conserved in bacteria (DUF2147)
MVPDGAWLIDGTGGAVQIFDCDGLPCGRIVWLWMARDIAGRPASDKKNPDPAFRQRLLCGLTILQGLQPAGLDHWNSGSLYNPDDGVTYRDGGGPSLSPGALARQVVVSAHPL